MRRILKDQPRNAVRWTDLALVHVNLGQLTHARREMEIAARLAPNNRFVLRSAARMYVLLGEPDFGLQLLRDSESKSDPWLRAAEIALAEQAGRRSKQIRSAKRAIEAGDVAPFHASVLLSLLIMPGEKRQHPVRSASDESCSVEPTENTVAQAEWASQHGVTNPSPEALALPRSFEARALDASNRGEFALAVQEAYQVAG